MRTSTQAGMRAAAATATSERAVVTLLFALIVVSTLTVLWPTTRSMIEIWEQSSTYGHCYVVIPVALWMVWRESAGLVSAPVTPFWPGLALIAAIGVVWLLAELAGVAVVAHLAAVGMVVATVLTVFGRRWARQLAFPLGFLFFSVPFGDELLPVLMEWTADVTVAALRLTGIPVYREGNYFVIPSGSWSVIEACGGVRFLIAAAMTGCLFAWLQYRAPLKRAVFVCLALVVALLANWARAHVIVLAGHVSANPVTADHDLWGWLIFAAAMFGLFALGMRWADHDNRALLAPAESRNARSFSRHLILAVLAASLLTVAAAPVAAKWIETRFDPRPVQIERIAPGSGWQAAATAVADWTPELVAPSAVDVRTFIRDNNAVSVFRGVYRNQKQGAELVNAMNQIVRPESKRWRLIRSGTSEVRLSGEPTLIKTATVRGPSEQLLVWHWYWLAGEVTASDIRVRAQLAMQRLTGTSDTAAWVAVYTPVGDDIDAGALKLAAFVEAMSLPINKSLEATATR